MNEEIVTREAEVPAARPFTRDRRKPDSAIPIMNARQDAFSRFQALRLMDRIPEAPSLGPVFSRSF